MRKRSPLAGVTPIARPLRCSVIVNGEQCQGAVDQDRARTMRKRGQPLACRAHEHAPHAARMQAEDAATAQAYRERVARRRQHEVGLP